MIRCVAFDFDGTLVDSNAIKRQAFFDVVSDCDRDGSVVTEVLDEIRPGDRYDVAREIARLLFERGALPADHAPKDWAHRWAEAYTRRCEAAVSECPEIPGASDALEWLAGRGIALYINSATPEEPLRRVVQRRSMSRHFQGVLGGPASKVENLRTIRSDAGVEARELLFVGDGEDDRSAAARFGCPFAGLVRPGPSRFASEPPIRIGDLSELAGVVDGMREEAP